MPYKCDRECFNKNEAGWCKDEWCRNPVPTLAYGAVYRNVPAAKETPTTIAIDALGVWHKLQNEIYLIVENLNSTPIAYCTTEEEAKKYCDNMNDERKLYRYIDIPCADGKVDLMKDVYYCHVGIFSKYKEDDWEEFFCELKTPMAIYTKDISPKVITDFNDLYKYDIHLPLPSDTKDYIYVIFYTKSRIPMDEEKNMAVKIFKRKINKC